MPPLARSQPRARLRHLPAKRQRIQERHDFRIFVYVERGTTATLRAMGGRWPF
jgi:hypothetical protein